MSKKLIFLITLIVVIGGVFLYKGFENKVDPLWTETQKVIDTEYSMLYEHMDELQQIYDSLHPNKHQSIIPLINEPFKPTMTWDKYKTFLNKVLTEKKVLIEGPISTGKTTIMSRTANIIAGDKERIHKVICIEGLEGELHDEWVGHYVGSTFHPGKMLKIFNQCRKNPKQNYVIILDDADRIHRTTFFGIAIWNELASPDEYVSKIEGYSKEIVIPDNLYIISTTSNANSSKEPFTTSDFRRLSSSGPYFIKPSLVELKGYLLKDKKLPLTTTARDSLTKQMYYFSKVNEVIRKQIGIAAEIGQWSGIQKILKKYDFKKANDFVKSDLAKYDKIGLLTDNDFRNIHYSLSHNGKMKGSNLIKVFGEKLIDLGLFSEFTVALLFALFSFIGIRRGAVIRNKNIKKLLAEVEETENKYLTNKISYNDAYGKLLSVKDRIDEMAKNNKLSFSHANYLILNLEDTLKTVDFVHDLEVTNIELANFMKTVISDDNITKEEFDKHMNYLKENKNSIDNATYGAVKQHVVKLYHKSKLKFGRTKI